MYILEVSRGCPDERYPLNGVFELDQAKALAEQGHKVIFAAVDVRSIRRWRRWGLYRMEKDGLTVYNFSFPVGAISVLANSVQKLGFKRLYRQIKRREGKPDVVHAHFGDVAAAVVDTCGVEKIPYVVTEHSSAVNVDVLPEKTRTELTKTYAHAAAVIAVSGALKEKIKKHTGKDAVVVPNIVDLSLFEPTSSRRKGEGLRFISAGNLVPGKGFDVLLDAFQCVVRTRPDARLLIMGGGPEKENLQNRIRDLGLEETVCLYGAYRREEFAAELKISDVFVLASRGETFGVVYVEAMAGGLPVVATRCGGPEDFVTAENGLLVDVDDAQALAEAMVSVADRRHEYNNQLIAASAAEKFSKDAVANQLGVVFQECIKS